MRKQMMRLAALTVTTAALAACIDLSGPRLDKNPNSPSDASAGQLLASVQAFMNGQLTGDYTRLASLYVQHMAGTGRQWITLDAPYLNDESQFGSWNAFYTGGGLVDIRSLKTKVAADKKYLGIAQVWEAIVIGTVADYWGNVPYSQALGTNPAPTLDNQNAIYGSIQILLDSAITNLGIAGAGPGSADLAFGGDATKWIAAAHTLKARYALHVNPSNYALAATQAALGISSAANDWKTYQSSGSGEENQWFQFYRGRGTDVGTGKFLVDLMNTRSDPRRAEYFSAIGGVYRGAPAGYEDDGTISWLSATRGDAAFLQPLVTWAENQLILAEAQQRTGNNAGALATLNAERTVAGFAAPLAGLTGTPLLAAILEEKYVALFQNGEAWYDYRRTCWPNIPLQNGAQRIPPRFLYGADERNANSNVPSPSAAPRYNPSTPRLATAVDGSACLGQQP